MQYPIFSSVVNSINNSLTKRGISTRKFKTWEDNRINASGLEIAINLSKSSEFIETLEVDDQIKAELKNITPSNYIGQAKR